MNTNESSQPGALATKISKTSKVSLIGPVPLTAAVAPCSWMYPGYPFQISVSLGDAGGRVEVIDCSLTFHTATLDDMERMLRTVKTKACKCDGCDKTAFDPESVMTNRDGACESCFMQALRQEFEESDAKAKAELAKLDAAYKAQGYSHRVDAWIHNNNGDDRFISFWMTNPTEEQIKAEIKKQGSCVLDDYSKVEI